MRLAARNLTQLLATLAAGALSVPAVASAHFFLEEPENWQEQGTLGDPQKTGPCGNEGPSRPTGAVTAYRSGQTITIRLRETIFHPGHYRVALATTDRSELPAVPPVTPGPTDCGSVPIMDPPVFPVLGDGLLPHTSPLSGEQTLEVTLPDGVTCDHCTLQIVQWMSSHGAPCFYYHCADLSISDVVVEDAGATSEDASMPGVDAATSTTSDAASPTATDSGTTTRTDAGPSSSSGGCACSVANDADARGAVFVFAIVLGAIVRRRGRR
jgi:MYXO-CTERM domain-containing protein